MERFGGRPNPRSGARWDRKNDGRTDTELVEFKRTDNRRSITLFHDDLRRLVYHAMVECRRPVLCFELCGDDFVVLPEREYHQLAELRPQPGAVRRLSAHAAHVPRRRQVPQPLQPRQPQSVLRRSSAQRSGAGGQGRLSGDSPRSPRALPGPRTVPGVRPGERGEVGRLGRVLRKGAAQDEAPEAS
jgi:hypothetical protein